ncbi:hypothetical protein Tco_1366827, partial [Tanacetum coccineum]
LFRSTYPGRHVARERYPQRQVARDTPDLSMGNIANVVESFKVNFRGKVHWVRAIEVPGWIPEFNDEEKEDDVSDECNFDGKPEAQEENNIFDESEEEKVQETEFGVPSGEKVNKSEDPFGIYSLLQKNKTNMENKVNEEDHSLSHPPGFTPEVDQFEGNGLLLN